MSSLLHPFTKSPHKRGPDAFALGLLIALLMLVLLLGSLFAWPAHADSFAAAAEAGTCTSHPFALTWNSAGSGSGFNSPAGVAVDDDGNVYVADTSNHRIVKFTGSGAYVAQWGSAGSGDLQFQYPTATAIDGDGNIYVSDKSNHRIQKLDKDGAYVTQWSTGVGDGQQYYPYGIALDSAGNVYVADPYNNRIQKFTTAGVYVKSWGTLGNGNGEFQYPYGVAVDGDDNVYVADTNNVRVQKFSADGSYLAQWSTAPVSPDQITLDGAGNIYVVDKTNAKVQEFTAAGAPLDQWGTGGSDEGQFLNPAGVAADEDGNVYVADTDNNRIQKFGCQSGYTLTITKAGTGDGSVVTDPVSTTFEAGAVVTLTATADGQSTFDGWDGALSGTTNPATLTVDGNKTVTATFTLRNYTLTIQKTGTGDGSVVTAPTGTTFDAGTVVTLTATADGQSTFGGWGGALSGTTNPATLTMDGNKTVTAAFTLKSYTLTIQKSGAGNGNVVTDPSGTAFDAGTVVTLTATADGQSAFDGWGGALSGTTNPATLTMDGNKTVNATFASLNQPPVADAGAAQTVRSASPVQLDGSGSTDSQSKLPLTFAWTQHAGTSVTLTGANTGQPAFTAPQVATGAQTLTFRLVVTNTLGVESVPVDVNVTVVPNKTYLPFLKK